MKNSNSQIRLAAFYAILISLLALGYWAVFLHEIHGGRDLAPAAIVALLGYVAVLYLRPRSASQIKRPVALIYWVFAGLFYPWLVLRQYFGAVTVSAVVYHWGEGVTGGVNIPSILAHVAALVLIAILLHAIYLFVAQSRWGNFMLLSAATVFLVLNPITRYVGDNLSVLGQGAPESVRAFASDPIITAEPDQPRNLVIVLLEGLEATYENPVFGDAYAPLADLRESATSFSSVRQIPMTGWSVAGLVASQCGYPTPPRGVRPSFLMSDKEVDFMSDRVCLGDVLSKQGYQVEMLLGANAVFGGFEAFLNSHSFDRVTDLQGMKAYGATDFGPWGFHDGEVFKAGLARIRELEMAGAPYALSLFTIGPHGPYGYLSEACRSEGMPDAVPDVLLAVECTGRLARDFVNEARKIADPSTLFVVMSDHLAHSNVSAIGQLKTLQRRNTVFFVNAGNEGTVVGKRGTMLDVYPTILEALGFELKGRKAGLGTSLYSGIRSFADGEDQLTTEQRLRRDVRFVRWLWRNELGDEQG
ncbi:sulfatase-like hydrolase/transferase [Aliiroseovarius sp. F20344]|uniref:sulfatase-like hydrolase/transferase n=1 Tax=Aliiroseovarius sp. F20344 TaxID=2926414 RepID=UPI001FF61310|nr:sulfatase-like hydrolase/transferase [Aliiroseovarius sp. F20344]MCK0142501.1 sulfatase-like hydrolase/transferase [Aliiroseovarius sp. F20344]